MRFSQSKSMGLFIWLSLLCGLPQISIAQDYQRPGGGDVFFLGQKLNGSVRTISDFRNITSLGFGIGGCLGHIGFCMGVFLGTAQDGKYEFSCNGGHFLFDYYFLKTRLTPLVTGGVGAYKISRPGSVWATDYRGLFNFGIGARWDLADPLFLKIVYNLSFMTSGDTASEFSGSGFFFNLGFRFIKKS